MPNHYQYPTASLRRVDDHHTHFALDLSDWMQWHLYFGFSDPSQDNLLSLCRPGDYALDIGANIGATMVLLGERVGPTGQVLGFEPDPQSFQKCQEHLLINSQSHMEVFQLGLGNEQAEKWLRVRVASNQGMNQVSPMGEQTDGTRIKITTLDHFFSQRSENRIDLIKIDVEGYEAEVLRGAKATIEKFRPRLFVEIDDLNLKDHGSAPKEIYDLLESLGYDLFQNNERTPLRRTTDRCHFDLVGIPRTKA